MIDVDVKGLKELQRKTEKMVADMHGAPILNAMRDSTLLVERKAKQNSPVDTGRLRSSILPEIRIQQETVFGVVGSNVIYAPYIELGTRPHFPPINAVQVWAARRGLNAYLVARAISRRGTKPRPFLTNAFKDSEAAINRRFDRALKEIVEQ